MNSSRNIWVYKILSSDRTVFTADSLKLMLGKDAPKNLAVLLNRLVKKGMLENPRRGIYAKPGYNAEELACRIYTPCYLSLEYVLQRTGVIFQYSEVYTCVALKSTSIVVDERLYEYRKIKGRVMTDMSGINIDGSYAVATPERALLDTLYLNSNYNFDRIDSLDRKKIFSLLPIYKNKTLEQRVLKLFG